jgi:hypothetical protein
MHAQQVCCLPFHAGSLLHHTAVNACCCCKHVASTPQLHNAPACICAHTFKVTVLYQVSSAHTVAQQCNYGLHLPSLHLTCCAACPCLVQLAAQLNWPPEDGLVRLENFKEPWQRALCRY